MIGLALSGGGARAIAFHLGCMRALHERGVLSNVSIISSVSGGSVIGALYAYFDESFEQFDERVQALLRSGLHDAILSHVLSPSLLVRILFTNLISRPAAFAAGLNKKPPPFRRWATRSDGLDLALRDVLGEKCLANIARKDLEIVFNACEMRTGTSFRFSNKRSGARRFGEIVDNNIPLSYAVACSAAYPMFLPAFDREYTFRKNGQESLQRVVITDGGVYDNLGIACMEPNRDERFSLHTFAPDYIICCYAGHGQFSGDRIPFGFLGRTEAAFECIFRKVQDAALQRLHMYKQSGALKGFILPYLGQQDGVLPIKPADLVKRDAVFGYPTDFAAMRTEDMERLTKRGEQLTRILLAHYCPEL